ncbi:MAG: hypothetical protein Q9175_002325 [Cornicularia normoerica]
MTLLRISRSINSEVSPFFYNEATYRIFVNVHHPSYYTKNSFTRPSPQHIKETIQNIDIYWVLHGPEYRTEGEVEALSWDPPISRGLCCVFFGWNPDGGIPSWAQSSGPVAQLSRTDEKDIAYVRGIRK